MALNALPLPLPLVLPEFDWEADEDPQDDQSEEEIDLNGLFDLEPSGDGGAGI